MECAVAMAHAAGASAAVPAVGKAAKLKELRVRDCRRLHALQPVLTLDALRAPKERRSATGRATPAQASTSYPMAHANAGGDGDGTSGAGDMEGVAGIESVAPLGPGYRRAREALGRSDPALLARLDKRALALRRKYARRRGMLDNQGVFCAATNAIRANAMLRVEMHRSLRSAEFYAPRSVHGSGSHSQPIHGVGGSSHGAGKSSDDDGDSNSGSTDETPEAIYRRTVRRRHVPPPVRKVRWTKRVMQIPKSVMDAREREKMAAVKAKVGRYRQAISKCRAGVLESTGLSPPRVDATAVADGAAGPRGAGFVGTSAHSTLGVEAERQRMGQNCAEAARGGGMESGLSASALVARALERAEAANDHVDETQAWGRQRAAAEAELVAKKAVDTQARARARTHAHTALAGGTSPNRAEARKDASNTGGGANASCSVRSRRGEEGHLPEEDDAGARAAAEKLKRLAAETRAATTTAEQRRRIASQEEQREAGHGKATETAGDARDGAVAREAPTAGDGAEGAKADRRLDTPLLRKQGESAPSLALVDAMAGELPPLPEAAASSTSAWLQARLDRLFEVLRFSSLQQMEYVIKYTGRNMRSGAALDAALELWEAAAAAVSAREGKLRGLVSVIEDLQRDPHSLERGRALVVEQHGDMTAEVNALTGRCLALSEQLTHLFDDTLTFDGRPYADKILAEDDLMTVDTNGASDDGAEAAHVRDIETKAVIDGISRTGAAGGVSPSALDDDDDDDPLTAEEQERLEELLRDAEAPI